MSVKVMTWVFEHSRTVGHHRLVALAIADRANDDGRCWPGIDGLAVKARCSRATVKRATRQLVELGELEITDRGSRTNIYRFTLGCGLTVSPQIVGSSTTVVGSLSADCGLTSDPQDVRIHQKNHQSLRSRSLPEGETLTPERFAFARSVGLTDGQARLEWDKLRDHEFQAPRANWTATWRNWCRTAASRAGGHVPVSGSPEAPRGGSLEYRIRHGL